MKRNLAMLLAGLMALTTMVGCTPQESADSAAPTPSVETPAPSEAQPSSGGASVAIFRGVIETVDGTTAIVKPNEDQAHILSSGDQVSVSLAASDSDFVVGDEIVVYYTGEIMESYPLQIDVVDIVSATEFDDTMGNEDASTDGSDIETQPLAPMGSVVVNIEGTITEVSEDGQRFLLDTGKWVTVTANTELGIGGPNAAPIEEQFFEDTFRVGNSIAGFTEDESAEELVAYAIYTNWNWEDPVDR